jgi:hypothetical protein
MPTVKLATTLRTISDEAIRGFSRIGAMIETLGHIMAKIH